MNMMRSEAIKEREKAMDKNAVHEGRWPGMHAYIFKKWALTGQRRFQKLFSKDSSRKLINEFLKKLDQEGMREHAANYRSHLGEASNASLNTIPKWHIPRTIWGDDTFVYDMHERFFMQQPVLEGIRSKTCNCNEPISDAHVGICKKDGGTI